GEELLVGDAFERERGADRHGENARYRRLFRRTLTRHARLRILDRAHDRPLLGGLAALAMPTGSEDERIFGDTETHRNPHLSTSPAPTSDRCSLPHSERRCTASGVTAQLLG